MIDYIAYYENQFEGIWTGLNKGTVISAKTININSSISPNSCLTYL